MSEAYLSKSQQITGCSIYQRKPWRLDLGSKEWLIVPDSTVTGWWQLKDFYFDPYLGGWSKWTNIFQMGWNHQLGSLVLYVGSILLSLGELHIFTYDNQMSATSQTNVLKKVRGGGEFSEYSWWFRNTAPVDSFIFKSPEIMGFFREIYRLAWLARFHPGAFPEASLPSVSCDFCGGHGASSSTPPSCLLGKQWEGNFFVASKLLWSIFWGGSLRQEGFAFVFLVKVGITIW